MNNQHLRFAKDKFTVTTDPTFFSVGSHSRLPLAIVLGSSNDVETVRLSVQNSLCFALLDGTRQIGFARLVSDSAPAALAELVNALGKRPLAAFWDTGQRHHKMDKISVQAAMQGRLTRKIIFYIQTDP